MNIFTQSNFIPTVESVSFWHAIDHCGLSAEKMQLSVSEILTSCGVSAVHKFKNLLITAGNHIQAGIETSYGIITIMVHRDKRTKIYCVRLTMLDEVGQLKILGEYTIAPSAGG